MLQMKFLWVLCIGCVLVATLCEAQEASGSQGTTQGESTGARSRAIGGNNSMLIIMLLKFTNSIHYRKFCCTIFPLQKLRQKRILMYHK